MTDNTQNKYKIRIVDSKIKCIEVNGIKGNNFIYPDTSGKLPKLYVIKGLTDIFYVGITIQDIRERLRSGFLAKGEHGYYGYKWKELKEVHILVWTFPSMVISNIEAIEAELVYYIREKTGKWPRYQMEIHFHQASESELQTAKSILNECFK